MYTTTTAGSSVTIAILPNDETRLSSSDPWFRLLRAIADLFLAGEIDANEVAMQTTHWTPQRGDFTCPAAKQLYGHLSLAWMEPKCGHDPYKGCDCPELTDGDRRARLRELIGG